MKFKLIESNNQYTRIIHPYQLSPGDVVEELSFEGDSSPSKFTVDYVDVSNGKIRVYTTDNSVLIMVGPRPLGSGDPDFWCAVRK